MVLIGACNTVENLDIYTGKGNWYRAVYSDKGDLQKCIIQTLDRKLYRDLVIVWTLISGRVPTVEAWAEVGTPPGPQTPRIS